MEMKHMHTGPRWFLYHGTSTHRLKKILAEDRLRRAPMGDEWVSLTTERSVAEHFAEMAVCGDQDDRAPVPIMESDPVVLVVDGEALIKLNYDLQAVNCDDPVF